MIGHRGICLWEEEEEESDMDEMQRMSRETTMMQKKGRHTSPKPREMFHEVC